MLLKVFERWLKNVFKSFVTNLHCTKEAYGKILPNLKKFKSIKCNFKSARSFDLVLKFRNLNSVNTFILNDSKS